MKLEQELLKVFTTFNTHAAWQERRARKIEQRQRRCREAKERRDRRSVTHLGNGMPRLAWQFATRGGQPVPRAQNFDEEHDARTRGLQKMKGDVR